MKTIIAYRSNKFILLLSFVCILSLMWLVSAKMNEEPVRLSEKKEIIIKQDIQPQPNIIGVDSALSVHGKVVTVKGVLTILRWGKKQKTGFQVAIKDEISGTSIPVFVNKTDKDWLINYLLKMENNKVIAEGKTESTQNTQTSILNLSGYDKIQVIE